MTKENRSLYWVLAGPAAALLLAAVRFTMQGSAKLYTETDKQFYLPDPDLGYKLAADTYHWLGLERTAAIIGFAAALAVASFLLLRRERKKEVAMKRSRIALFCLSPLPLLIPLMAFLGGSPPSDARATIPSVKRASGTEIAASLPSAPAGIYNAVLHDGTLIAAGLKAGGDSFEAKFTDVRGHFSGDPSDLTKPLRGEFFAKGKSVDTGIPARSSHATEYLKVEEFPDIGFRIDAITSTSATDSPNRMAFSGNGAITIVGKEVSTTVNGTVRALDDAGKKRLGLGGGAALVVNGTFSLRLSETPIGADDFTKDEVPITFSLVLKHEGTK